MAFRQAPAIDNRMSFDCHGLSFADAQFYINNDQVPTLLQHDNYSETNKPQVGDIVVYTISGQVVHSATVTGVGENGQVTQVTGLGGIEVFTSSTDPQHGFYDQATGRWATPSYYHKNNSTTQQNQANAQRVQSTPPKNVLTEKDLKELGPPPKMAKPPKKKQPE